MKTLLTILAFTCTIAVAGCGQPPMSKEVSKNGAEAALIAIVKGCEVYRITDWSRVYVTVCPDGRSDTSWREQSGKTTVKRTSMTVHQ